MFIPLLITSLLVMSVSLLGVILVWRSAGGLVERNLHILVSFAAGVLIVLVFNLSHEVIELSSNTVLGLIWIFIGLLSTSLITKLMPQAHHHHGENESPQPHTTIDARNMLIGDSLHNLGDGILIATSFLVSFPLGIAAAFSIVTHEVVQEISEFFVLRQAGYSTKKALQLNVATASTVLVGAVGGYFLLGVFEILEAPILGFAAGALLVLLLQDLIPHSISHARSQKCLPKHILAVILGSILMFAIFQVTGSFH